MLVDAVTARQKLSMPPETTEEEAYLLSTFTMRAALDGRWRDLIDLARVNLWR